MTNRLLKANARAIPASIAAAICLRYDVVVRRNGRDTPGGSVNAMAKKKELTAETKYQLLLQISQEVRDTLDVDETLDSILDVIRSILDYDAAGIFDLNQGIVYPRHGHPRSRIAGIADRGFDTHQVETDDMLMHGKGIVGHVIRTGESIVAPDVRLDPRYVVGRARTRSEIAVPIARERAIVWALNLESDRIQAYETDDLEVLRFFAEAAAISISKAMLHHQLVEKERIEDQLRTANLVQSRLLPAEPAALPGYDIAGTCIPTYEIGGDYFDYLHLPDGRRGIVIADVAGKGIPAALIMMAFRALLRAFAGDEPDVSRLMQRVSRQLRDFTGTSHYVTAVYGVLHPVDGRFEYANCGHNAPLLVRSDGRTEWLESGGTFLGLLMGSRYESRSVTLEVGDTLILYTDGVVDCQNANGEEFGADRLARLMLASPRAPATEAAAAILAATRDFSASSSFADDFTLLVVRRHGSAMNG